MNNTAWKFRSYLWDQVIRKLPETSITASTKHGKMSFSNKDTVIGRRLYVEKAFELDKIVQTLRLLDKYNAPVKGTVLDIGANVGTVSCYLGTHNFYDRVIAFEPEPKNFDLLLKNVSQNGLAAKIQCVRVGLSNQNRQRSLKLSSSNFGDHRISVGESTERSILVWVRKLDEILCAEAIECGEIALIWMDVQGHEPFVFEGARELLRHGIFTVVEFWPFGLREAKVNLKHYQSLLREFFTSFIDLNDESENARDINEFQFLFDKYEGEAFTDLFLIPKPKPTFSRSREGLQP